eukprot:g12648.t1 g12648   contig6:2352814-2353101(-)
MDSCIAVGAASPLPSFEEEKPPTAIAVDIAENEDVQFDNDDRVDLLDAGNDEITIDKVEQQNGGGVVLPTTCTRRKTEVVFVLILMAVTGELLLN